MHRDQGTWRAVLLPRPPLTPPSCNRGAQDVLSFLVQPHLPANPPPCYMHSRATPPTTGTHYSVSLSRHAGAASRQGGCPRESGFKGCFCWEWTGRPPKSAWAQNAVHHQISQITLFAVHFACAVGFKLTAVVTPLVSCWCHTHCGAPKSRRPRRSPPPLPLLSSLLSRQSLTLWPAPTHSFTDDLARPPTANTSPKPPSPPALPESESAVY